MRKSKEQPIAIASTETLVIDTKACEAIKFSEEEKAITLAWMEKEDSTGRLLRESPIFTDGNHLYVVSLKKKIKSSEQDDEEDESFKISIVIESYDDTDFKHVKSV